MDIMEKISERAVNSARLSQKQENALNQIITLQITAIQLAGLYKINPKIIEEEMQKRGII